MYHLLYKGAIYVALGICFIGLLYNYEPEEEE